MATLTGQSIADSYEQLLSLPNGGLNGTTLVAITDGDSSTACVLEISTTKALIKGDESTLFFFDEGGEYIKADNAGKLFIAGAAEVEVNTAIFDVNASGSISIDSSAGSIDMNVVDGQTVAIGLNGGVETLWKPHGTAGSELWSTINTAGTTDGTDAAGSILLSAVAGGIGLAWADGKDLWAEGGRFVVTANENAADAIKLHADAGSSQTITIVNDAGTGAAAIGLTASAGGITVGLGGGAGDDFIVDTTTLVVESDNNRVGIGTASPATTLDVVSGVSAAAPATSGSTQTSGTIFRLDGSDAGVCDFGIQSGGAGMWIQSTNQTNHATNYPIRLNENGGNVGIGMAAPSAKLHMSSSDAALGTMFKIQGTNASMNAASVFIDLDCTNDNTVGGIYFMICQDSGAHLGTIRADTDNATLDFNASSDYRLKENVSPVTDALTRINQLNPVKFNFKKDPNKKVRDGLIAHEAQAILPYAVTGDKDAMSTKEYEVSPRIEATYDVDGDELTPVVEAVMGEKEVISPQMIDYSKLTPILIAAVKELSASNDALKARIEVLEAA
jgi:hypothetical protein